MLIDYLLFFMLFFYNLIFLLYVIKIDATINDIDNELYEIKKYIRDIDKKCKKK